MTDLNRIQGCLIGGGAGDALGYAVEFDGESRIFRTYGPEGIREYERKDGVGRISDDTQMTLYTAEALVLEGTPIENIYHAYLDWLKTQRWPGGQATVGRYTWLNSVPELNYPRAPGNTCLAALRSGNAGSVAEPINNSKGCGGVMRVAPIGLLDTMPRLELVKLGAEAAAVTHGHGLGYLPAAALVSMVHTLSHTEATVPDAVDIALGDLAAMFPDDPELENMQNILEEAVRRSGEDISDLEGIHALGEGWVGEEALAIAVFCALRHPEDFAAGIIAAVNHKGDSDSTGAIAGNLLGARLGLSGIPEHFVRDLELRDVILEVADDLHRGRTTRT